MRIRKLKLMNFSSHVSTEIEFTKPCALIVGYLGTGKSSIAQAIEYALTGDCGLYRKKTDDRNEIIHDLLPAGAALGSSIDTDRGLFIRSQSQMAKVWTVDQQTMQNADAMDRAVAGALNVTKEMLAAILNVGTFFELPAAEQKDMIIRLIGAEVTHDKVVELFNVDGDAGPAFKLLSGPINSLAAIENAYQYAFDRRTVVKRELKDLKPPSPPEGEKPPLDKMHQQMAHLRVQLEEQVKARATMTASVNTQLRVDIERRIAAGKQMLATDQRLNPTGSISQLKDAQQAALDAKTHFSEMYVAVERKLVEVRAKVLSKEQNVKLLINFDGKCVAGDHVCPAPTSDMEAARDLQAKALAKLRRDEADLAKELADLRSKRDDDTEIRKAAQAMQQFEDALALRERSVLKVQDLEEQLEGLPANQVAADTSTVDQEIQKLRDRIKDGEQKIQAATGWLERERAVTAVAQKRAALEKELSLLEQLVEFFGPKGVKVKLIDERIGGFVGSINERLAPLGFELAITVEPWRIFWGRRPISRLSRSERFRMAIPFQIALAQLTKLNFIIVDDAEMLTPDARTQVMKMILTAGLEQAIVIMTFMDEQQFLANKLPAPIEAFVVRKVNGVSQVEKI